ncbi:MAG TPA: BamA/TamA family outer membrane protein [Kofleriaceae bacterium]|nr:BamA/TamA family outer membrane protein [Kofleriaceae bacterium]
MKPAVVTGLAAAALVLTLAGGPARADRIKEVLIVENSKTTDDTVLYIAGIEEGDEWDQETQERVKRDLVSSGLFKEVDVFSEPHPKGGGVRVTIIVKDKHSWVIAPTFYNQPTNTGGGLGFGENNLFGENKKLLLYGQVATGDTFFIGAYVDPSIAGTPFNWQADVFLRYERVIEYSPPTRFIIDEEHPVDPVRKSKMMYLNGGLKFGVTILRSLKLEQRIRGAKVAFYKNQLHEDALGDESLVCGGPCPTASGEVEISRGLPEPGAEGWDMSTESVMTFDRRANWYGITTGSKLQLSYETSIPGSDFDYWYSTFSFERAVRFFKRTNFIIRGMAGYGRDLPLQQEYTGGGTTLRGYENKILRGDVKGAANLEYSVPFFTIKGFAFRGLLFVDSAYVAFLDIEPDDTFRHYLPNADVGAENVSNLAPWKNSVGGGIRLYVRQIVLPLLGLDLGYGLESGGVEVYFAIGVGDF